MLTRIFIQNIALIDKLDVAFEPGFNVLTGETGAGKSILIDAVNLVLGERADRELIGKRAPKALVEAVFSIEDPAVITQLEALDCPPEDGEFFLSRELLSSGKNTCRINGRLVGLSLLQSVSKLLVDVHGQHEHQSLLNPSEHLRMLDGYGEARINQAAQRVRKCARDIAALSSKIKNAHGSAEEIEREIDSLKNQTAEISAAALMEDEEVALSDEAKLLGNAEVITQALETGYGALYGAESGGAYGALREALAGMRSLEPLDESFAALCKRIEDVYYAAEDIALELRSLKAKVENDPYRLEEIQARLDMIDRLGRKYGSGTKKILQYYCDAVEKIQVLEDFKAEAESADERLKALTSDWHMLAGALSKLRKEAALGLKSAVEEQLHELGMKSAQFSVSFSNTERISENGFDSVEFLLSTNKGEALKPLHKVASGGEMSRIMLALKTIGANIDGIETLIFDEIDAGISGRTAAVVGEKLFSISGSRQILCVTHQAQIAALADAHYAIEKEEIGENTFTRLQKLDNPRRVMEIARLIGAENSSSGQEHAKELIKKASEIKRY